MRLATSTAGGSVIHMDGACAGLTIDELQAVHVLQLRRPRDWHLQLEEAQEPSLQRAAAVCRDVGADELAPERIRRALRRSARCATREALEPARHWVAGRGQAYGNPQSDEGGQIPSPHATIHHPATERD